MLFHDYINEGMLMVDVFYTVIYHLIGNLERDFLVPDTVLVFVHHDQILLKQFLDCPFSKVGFKLDRSVMLVGAS